ncbi:hypothetical protein HanXRQr2_Chr17g0778641 [Helianthus annuus]|uniref:Uncharacterized protein n=1 Tax=Helianthus annuus TaxID=4232 RepID=A0A9K3DER7_HELAN|nr:hypothetical protein HanXRQr2_Chr17g0778641 [Helianthus annuus]
MRQRVMVKEKILMYQSASYCIEVSIITNLNHPKSFFFSQTNSSIWVLLVYIIIQFLYTILITINFNKLEKSYRIFIK